MSHIFAACGPGTPAHQNCVQYMTSSWSLGGVLLGLVILGLVILVVRAVRSR